MVAIMRCGLPRATDCILGTVPMDVPKTTRGSISLLHSEAKSPRLGPLHCFVWLASAQSLALHLGFVTSTKPDQGMLDGDSKPKNKQRFCHAKWRSPGVLWCIKMGYLTDDMCCEAVTIRKRPNKGHSESALARQHRALSPQILQPSSDGSLANHCSKPPTSGY